MQKDINYYQEMASEHRLQENCRSPVSLSFIDMLKYLMIDITIE